MWDYKTKGACRPRLYTLYEGEHDKHFMFGIKKDKQKLHANYRIGRIIGDGNFAVVRECTHRKTTKSYALKIINKAKVKGKEHMIENEIHILRKIIHPNIVKLHEEFETQKEIYLVMELVTGGDLFDAIVANTRFSEPCSAYMIRDLASAVKYLHELSIVHRDIKPENLLVVNRKDGRRSLKLADFGLSIEVKAPVYLVCGTPTYVAPEILDESGYGLKVDVWAIGVICYILLCGFPPFRSANHDQEELFDKILRGDYEYLAPFWDDVNDGPKDLIDRLLVVDASERYDADEVLNHYWIKKWISPSESALRKQKQRPRFRPIAMALVSFLSLLRLVRSRQHRTDTYTNIRSISDNGTSRPYPVLSRIPRPKPSAGFHIAEIRKSISTPTHRASRSDSTSGADRKSAVGGEEYKPVASPECTLKKGFLKREEVIKRVLRSNSDRKSQLASKPTARVRPTSAAHSKVRTTTPTASGHSTPTKTLKEDNDSKKLFVPRPCQHGNIFGGNNIGFNSTSSDHPGESVKPNKHRLTSSASVRDLKSSVDAVQDSVPMRKRSTSAKLRPRSMIETTKASSELNLSKPSNDTKPVEKPRNSSVTRRMSLERRNNKNDCGECSTPKRSVAMTNLNNDNHWSRGYQTDSETQNSCKCSPSATVTRQSSQRITNSQSNLQSQQKVFSSGEFAFTGENTSNTSIRKSRSSCRKVPRKPVFRHASSIQSLASDKYSATRRGLYRVKSLESTHHSITGCGGTTGGCSASVSGGSTRGSSRSLQQECSSCALPPWNPSTNVNSKPGSIAASSPLSRKRGIPARPQSSTNKIDKTKGTSGSGGAGYSDSEKHDKGIKITTEVNKRKNIKFPDGKTVDEEVKTTTTVRVQNYGPPAEEECEESSLLTKVKNLAIEIGSLAKVKYNLSSDSSSDSVLLTNDKPAPPHVTNKSDSDLTDTTTNKEETDRFSETEYLSAFRKK